ncbi:ATP-dependent Clp protease ATP-binding subunit [Candidatus Gracilibacteria bacterium]|nr:ATP-dependent Clp protease ATP-binding subunit [Candidatus Gracilibacteria bacterium]
MLNQFTEEYRNIMLAAEQRAKQFGYREILPEDVLIQVAKVQSGNIYDLFGSFGINDAILLDLFSRSPFHLEGGNRSGDYMGISPRLKQVIVDSMKTAAKFQKGQAGLEDFLLALLHSETDNWFIQVLDFIGIDPKGFEVELIEINTLIAGAGGADIQNGGIFGPIDDLMHLIEDTFGGAKNEPGKSKSENKKSAPFDQNPPQDKKESKTPGLDFFGTDLTLEARNKKIDPIFGRDTEIDRLISILNRKTKNNPCLVGDPGVGKTAVVEGLARKIVEGTVPFAMQNKRIISLNLSQMVAGTKYRGEFEQRIKLVIDEASKLENEVIIFIDEIHTIIGAGSGEGSLDAANILKPAMARGKISLIGATTLNEYQKYIEKDSALERRFQKIDVAEPTKEVASMIISGLRPSFEEFHNLIIDDDAIADAVELSTRYITDRFLPDKAIDLIDEACSTKSMTYNFDTSEVTELKEKVQGIQKEMEDLLISQQYQKALKKRKLIESINTEIDEKKNKRTVPRKDRLHITGADIQRVIHQISGIPLKNLEKENMTRLRLLDSILKKRILGQSDAIDAITSSLKRSSVGISNPNRPIGSFLFLGPTGVGKTELVKVLAEEFFADPKALIKIDMSEFQDKSSASKLIGTTAGYVGYEEGGMLTEKVRRKPYSIILLDEIEKGNFDVYNLLLQILEDGMVTDGKGRAINFKNTIIIMTSNIGSDEFNEKAAQIGFLTGEKEEEGIIADYANIREKVLKQLPDFFAPEFLNRIDKTIVFNPLDKKVLKNIITLQLEELITRLALVGVVCTFDSKAVSLILKSTYNPEYGARPVRRYIQDRIEDVVADSMISGNKKKKNLLLSAKGEELIFNWI